MSVSRVIYTALMYLALPLALLRLVWRARRQSGYLRHVGERFGRYTQLRPNQLLIWIHAVSVGETRAAQPLVKVLLQRHPDCHILFTHMTPTGRETGAELFGDRVLQCYLPYDFPGAVKRFLAHYRPRLGVLMETEIWCNLIHHCRIRDIPIYLVNARLSEKSMRGYQRFATLSRETLQALSGIAAQTADDARRLQTLGAQGVAVTGNIKFDVDVPDAQLERGLSWRTAYGGRPVLLAASTREGEEVLLLDALNDLDLPGALLVIVPRHPQRFEDVARLLGARGLRYQRRSADGTVDADTRVFLGDSMGEMFAYYAACDVAFIGGSLLPYGGQNLIEACVVGKPAIVGPSTYNFTDAADGAIAAGAALRVSDASELMRAARQLLIDCAAAQRMGETGRAFALAHRGATQRTMDMLRFTSAEK